MVLLEHLTGSLGVSIILFTIFVRVLLLPLMLPSLRTMQKQRELQPQLEKIKQKFKYDKKIQAEKQMELLKQHGISPAAGCLTQLPMLVVLIALFSVIRKFTGVDSIESINSLIYFDSLKFGALTDISLKFGFFHLGKADPSYVLPVLSGVLQFVASKMTMPYVEKGIEISKKTPDKSDDIAYNVQEQMLFMMPIMTVLVGLKLPSGTVLYILVTTLFSIVQSYYVTGWGGLYPLVKRIKALKAKN